MSHTLSASNDLSATGLYANIAEQGTWPDSNDYYENEGVDNVAQPILSQAGNQYDYESLQPMFVKSSESSLLIVFSNAIQQLRSASLEDQIAVKTLLNKEIFPEFKTAFTRSALPIKPSEPRVTSKINEELFKNLYLNVEQLVENTKKLRDKATIRIKLIAGATPTLNPKDSDYEKIKAGAAEHFKDYEPLYNRAVEMLTSMREKEEAIDSLQKLANETIDQFINENNIHIQHFQAQFNILHSEHGFVDERVKIGYESTKSRFIGVASSVALPEPKKVIEDLTQSKLDLSDDFSPFFLGVNVYYDELKDFSDKVQAHLDTVAGTRKAWSEKNPYFSDFKDNARLLTKDYEPLAKTCNTVYATLTQHNEKLEDLKTILGKRLAEKTTQIREAKQLMIETFGTYAEESKNLDRKMNNGSLTIYKDIRILAALTVEKYPISKEKDTKEVKEVAL